VNARRRIHVPAAALAAGAAGTVRPLPRRWSRHRPAVARTGPHLIMFGFGHDEGPRSTDWSVR